MALTARQARFVAEYLIDLNATQAAIRAGYSKRTSEQQGFQLLKKTSVAEAIQAAQANRANRTQISQDRVLTELARIGFSDLRKAVSWVGDTVQLTDSSTLDDDTALALSEVSQGPNGIKIKMHDKLAALDKLARHLGMFKGEGPDGDEAKTLNINITTAAPIGDVRVTRSDA